MTKPVLYQHFASKRELYLALLDEVGRELLEAIAKATAGAVDGRAQTEAGFGAYFRWVDDDRDAFLLLFGSGARRDEEFAEAVRKVEEAIAEAIEPLIAADIDAEPPAGPWPTPSSGWPRARAASWWPPAWPSTPSSSPARSPTSRGPASGASAGSAPRRPDPPGPPPPFRPVATARRRAAATAPG